MKSMGAKAPALVYVTGTRPNLVKLAPVVHELRRSLPLMRHVVVHTGQHYDRELSDVFLEELGLSKPTYYLRVGSGPHGAQTGRALERVERVLLSVRPVLVVVPGDVNSTLAGALAAAKLGIPIAHIEAGLRSFDWTMPEELNRVLVDRLSRWCFIHSPEAWTNLVREGIEEDRIHFVGNTMMDSLERLRPRILASDVHRRLRLRANSYLLVTLHRPALVDGPLFREVLDRLARLSRSLPVVFPVHPRSRAHLPESSPPAPRLHLTEPLCYTDFLALEARARAVLTDSGGVQEETTYLGVPCFTLRANTERPITIQQGTNRLLGLDPAAIDSIPGLLDDPPPRLPPPAGWDGRAGERVADVLAASLGPDALGDTSALPSLITANA
jgi:UDP-N-acetylglucosamine 2-epimerase (non-hydrolysing)